MSKYHICPACRERNTMSQAMAEWLTGDQDDNKVYCSKCDACFSMEKWEVWCVVCEVEEERRVSSLAHK